MTVGICTLGCKVNMYESEYITGLFQDRGYTIQSFDDVCDIYVINTCAVTNTSDLKSQKMIRRAIRQNQDACIVAMGCFVQANQDYHEQGLDIVLGNKDKSRIVDLVEEYFKNRQQIRDFYQDFDQEFEDMAITRFEGRTRAFVKIQDGCENFCSYCIIPYVRGKCRSKKVEVALREIQDLVQNGYQEVVLTGIHTGNYGVDRNVTFADLLKEIVKISGLKRLRISSIEITELTDEVLEIIASSPVIVDHLHIPLQAGSDPILRLMNRKYDLAYFEKKLQVIVGFPSESEELFQQTLSTVRRFAFSKIHVFPYSLRSGTKAETLPMQVDPIEKKERAKKLLNVSKELEIEYFKKFLNKEVEVLVERVKDGYSYGHTGNYLAVKIKGEHPVHEMCSAWIEEIEYPYCVAEVKDQVPISS